MVLCVYSLDGNSGLVIAAQRGQLECIHALLECGNINTGLQDHNNRTAAHLASLGVHSHFYVISSGSHGFNFGLEPNGMVYYGMF